MCQLGKKIKTKHSILKRNWKTQCSKLQLDFYYKWADTSVDDRRRRRPAVGWSWVLAFSCHLCEANLRTNSPPLVQNSFVFFVWIQQRVQHSWTQTGTLGRRQTASLSWPFTPTQTAVAAGVEVWEMVMPTARGAQGVRRTHTPTDS